jgi:hypothetical protein
MFASAAGIARDLALGPAVGHLEAQFASDMEQVAWLTLGFVILGSRRFKWKKS